MADALCGPSNPLQNLQKHTQVDRTLQQDRLVGSRQSPAQGFRTADPRAGSLDADFHAFETSTPNHFQFQQPDLFHPQNHAPSVPGGWASDFQRLSIHQSPVPAQQFRTEAPLIKSTSLGGWQNEFMRQRSSAGTPIAQGKQAIREAPQMMNYSQPTYQPYTSAFQQQPQMQQPTSQLTMEQHLQVSDVDFEAAFADALNHAQKMDQDRALGQMKSDQFQPQAHVDPVDLQSENIKIGSDALPYLERHERTEERNTRDADELARTAGELLSSVSHDTSEKFQNSQFLQLMRKIRDREVEVQNNDLHETGTGTGTDTHPSMDQLAANHAREMAAIANQEQERSMAQTEDTSHFVFPDMDAVYAATNSDAAWSDADYDAQPAATVRQQQSPYAAYGFDDDQYPQSQMEALHPGGKLYPDQSPQLQKAGFAEVEMSGAVPAVNGGGSTVEDGAALERRISASDFEHLDESAGLARRFYVDMSV